MTGVEETGYAYRRTHNKVNIGESILTVDEVYCLTNGGYDSCYSNGFTYSEDSCRNINGQSKETNISFNI